MKKGLLLLLGIFMMVSTVEANNGNKLTNRFGFNYSYENAINFVEQGVEFFIFTNGEFDFNTRFNNIYLDYNRRRYKKNRATNIDRDFRGRIRRIGNSYINYDRQGNVTRIGNVFMRYYRGRLTNVGNLKIRYDRWGNPNFFGNVKNNYYFNNGISFNLNIGDICDYNDAFFFKSDFRRNYSKIREDNNYYYYRANPKAKVGKRSQILRRKKPVSNRIEKNNSRTKNNTSYRKSSINSKRNVISERKSNSYRKSDATKRKTTKRKVEKRDKNKKNRRS